MFILTCLNYNLRKEHTKADCLLLVPMVSMVINGVMTSSRPHFFHAVGDVAQSSRRYYRLNVGRKSSKTFE
jgi:hypothetical protein